MPGALKSRAHDVFDRLLQQRAGIDDHRIEAAGFRDQHRLRIAVIRHRTIDRLRGFGGTGKTHAIDARISHQRRADLRAIARQTLQHMLRNAGLMHQFDRAQRNQRRLLGRFGDHHIAADQRRRNLPAEDRQRKIPRRNTHKQAARRQFAQCRDALHFGGVITAEIHRFAHFRQAVFQRLAGFARHQHDQLRGVLLISIGDVQQTLRALMHRRFRPAFS